MHTHMFNAPRHRRHSITMTLIGLVVVIGFAGIAAVTVLPAAGAQGAEVLRHIVGDRAVAQLETLVYQVQDSVHQWAYQHGARPASPWVAMPAATSQASPTPLPLVTKPQTGAIVLSPKVKAAPMLSATPTQAAQFPPTPTVPAVWSPTPLAALGSLPGEGQWSAYLLNPSGQAVAFRTFLQPDSQRAYAVAAVVSFDLNNTRLKFVLGSREPKSTVVIHRTGQIPPNDLQPGRLLATFNGGFKANNGHFGAMVDGTTVLPPRAGLGTVAIYADGSVRIGAWGTDITMTPDLIAWRQNGPLLIHNSQVNPYISVSSWKDWGWTVKGATAVWRSGLGISADGRTLYYVAGPSLTLPALTSAMATAGATQAIQLDINNYWVHFDAIQVQGSKLQPVPLFKSMHDGAGRYLWGYTRDFFYVTTRGG